MATQKTSSQPVESADEAVNIALRALQSVYGTWSYDIRECVRRDGLWIVDIYIVLFGVRRVSINRSNGNIEKIESVSSTV